MSVGVGGVGVGSDAFAAPPPSPQQDLDRVLRAAARRDAQGSARVHHARGHQHGQDVHVPPFGGQAEGVPADARSAATLEPALLDQLAHDGRVPEFRGDIQREEHPLLDIGREDAFRGLVPGRQEGVRLAAKEVSNSVRVPARGRDEERCGRTQGVRSGDTGVVDFRARRDERSQHLGVPPSSRDEHGRARPYGGPRVEGSTRFHEHLGDGDMPLLGGNEESRNAVLAHDGDIRSMFHQDLRHLRGASVGGSHERGVADRIALVDVVSSARQQHFRELDGTIVRRVVKIVHRASVRVGFEERRPPGHDPNVYVLEKVGWQAFAGVSFRAPTLRWDV